MLTENSDYITIEDTMRLFRLRLDEREEHRDIVIKYKIGISETFKDSTRASSSNIVEPLDTRSTYLRRTSE